MHGTYLVLASLFHLGRWSEMPDALEEHIAALPGEKDVPCFAVQGGAQIGALVMAHRGEMERARELAGAVPPGHGNILRRFVSTQARVQVALGDAEGARTTVERAFETLEADRAVEPALAMIEALMAQEDWDGLAKAIPRAREIAPASPALAVATDRAEGLVEASRGRRKEAVAKLTAALEGFERLKDRFEAARTREALAGAVEDPAERRRLLEQARDAYEELGAKPHMDRVSAAPRDPGPTALG